MAAKNEFEPAQNYLGLYLPNDGTVEFYSRIHTLLDNNLRVLNVGAGRGVWYEEDDSPFRRFLFDIRPKVQSYVGIDIDPAVLGNLTTTSNYLIEDGKFPFENDSFDLIIADWVLEHVEDPILFTNEIRRVLRTNGYFVARTPLQTNYVSIISAIVRNSSHPKLLKYVQPSRQAQDIFPATYRMNTRKKLKTLFVGFKDYSYIYVSNPSYYFGKRSLFKILRILHKWFPVLFVGNLHVFMKKES